MIREVYHIDCDVCTTKYGPGNGKYYEFNGPDKEEAIKQINAMGWKYARQWDWIICPSCDKRLKFLEPEVIWDGEQQKISEFVCVKHK